MIWILTSILNLDEANVLIMLVSDSKWSLKFRFYDLIQREVILKRKSFKNYCYLDQQAYIGNTLVFFWLFEQEMNVFL